MIRLGTLHPDLSAMAMLYRIGEQFLHNPIDRYQKRLVIIRLQICGLKIDL
ncbi:hypothetical protein D3C87_1966990 [compost metagenome]